MLFEQSFHGFGPKNRPVGVHLVIMSISIPSPDCSISPSQYGPAEAGTSAAAMEAIGIQTMTLASATQQVNTVP